MINVTDITAYLYCPRKFYLEKIKGLKQPPTKPMIEGKIRHDVLEVFSKNEKDFVINFIQKPKNLEKEFSKFLNELIHNTFFNNSQIIKSFSISQSELKNKILDSMQNDIKLRAEIIEKSMSQGLLGEELWHGLKPKYISEMPVESLSLRLRGRVDRVMLADEIIPFELKTREIKKVYETDEIQITAYAMLLEEKFQKPVHFGILESGNKKHEIIITNENKNKVIELINEIKNLSSPKFPGNFSKCQSCPWQEQCEQLDE